MVSVNYERKYVEDKEAVKAYIAKLKYALSDAYSRIIFQKFRVCDEDRDEKYTNEYTFDSLFPEGNENVVFRKELKKLTLQDYIETVEDRRRKNQDDFRVFSKSIMRKMSILKFVLT